MHGKESREALEYGTYQCDQIPAIIIGKPLSKDLKLNV